MNINIEFKHFEYLILKYWTNPKIPNIYSDDNDSLSLRQRNIQGKPELGLAVPLAAIRN